MSLREVLAPRSRSHLPALQMDGQIFPYASAMMQAQQQPAQDPQPPQRPRLTEYLSPEAPTAPVRNTPEDEATIKRNRRNALFEGIGKTAGAIADIAYARRNPYATIPQQQPVIGQKAVEFLRTQDEQYRRNMERYGKDLADYKRASLEQRNRQIGDENAIAMRDFEYSRGRYDKDADTKAQWEREDERSRIAREQKLDDREAQWKREDEREQSRREHDARMAAVRAAGSAKSSDAGSQTPEALSFLFTQIQEIEDKRDAILEDMNANPGNYDRFETDPRLAQLEEINNQLAEYNKGFTPKLRNDFIQYKKREELGTIDSELSDIAQMYKAAHQRATQSPEHYDQSARFIRTLEKRFEGLKAQLRKLGYTDQEIDEAFQAYLQ